VAAAVGRRHGNVEQAGLQSTPNANLFAGGPAHAQPIGKNFLQNEWVEAESFNS
jgi:hypothetical protein